MGTASARPARFRSAAVLSGVVTSVGLLAGLGLMAGRAGAADCASADVAAPVVADTWLDENSPFAAKGSDSILTVEAGSTNIDTGVVSGRARALVRFATPTRLPVGCVVESARLRLSSTGEDIGTRVEALRVASPWSEQATNWSNQPDTVGPASRIWSRDGYVQWNVSAQVQAMLEEGVDHGFLIRDAAEGAETGGSHGFYGKEKGDVDVVAELVIRFTVPGSEEPPGPPLPPAPAAVACGQVLAESTLVTNDLSGCLGDGLVIGAPRIIVDLGGHTIDGIGLGAGIRNDEHHSVTVRNGTIQEFDYGVDLLPGIGDNVIEGITFLDNQVAAVELFDASSTRVIGNTLDGNGGGIRLVSGTTGSVVTSNTITGNGGAGIFVQDAAGNHLEGNSVTGGGDLGIGLERAGGNTLIGNTSVGNSDGGIEIRDGSHGNRVEDNTVLESGDHGILVAESHGNRLVGNLAHHMSDSGITLDAAEDGVVQGNDVRYNTGGVQVDGSSRNVIAANNASDTSGIGIELGGGSLENVVERNTANANGAQGIYVADEATDPLGQPIPGLGNLLVANTANGNKADGIVVAKGGHTVTANVTRENLGWGINAALAGSIDGGGNVATGNPKPEQCMGVVCKQEWDPPETSIVSGPPAATRNTSASFAFAADEAASFACSLDGAPVAPCSSPQQYAGLAEGAHTFAVRATDAAGNVDASPATHAWTVEPAPDATAPDTAIDLAPEATTTSAEATFAFSASEPGVAFECRLDDPADAWITCSSPQTYQNLAVGAHIFEVRASDAAGNTDASPARHAWTVEPPADVTAPDTTITGGPTGTVTSAGALFTYTASEAGSTFACSLDDAPFAACTSPHQYGGLADGAHEFRVRATDPAGNTDPTAATQAWTVDSSAPNTTITGGPTGTVTATSASFTFTASEVGSTFQCSLDSTGFTACASPKAYGGLTAGSHTFRVRAVDPAGNIDASPATRTWTVLADTSAPNTTITGGPGGTVTSASALFTFIASEAGSTFQCSLDSAGFTACASPRAYSGLAAGSHTFRVRAVDAAGNIDASPATRTWTVATSGLCGAPVSVAAAADAWVDENSPSSNKGGDSVLKVQSKSPNDDMRALVRFDLPVTPTGCVVQSATLSVHAASANGGRTLQAFRLASGWSESGVTWSNQPAAVGVAIEATAATGTISWDVVAQVRAMLAPGANHGFLIRDLAEGAGGGFEQQLHAREKGESPPRLVVSYAAA